MHCKQSSIVCQFSNSSSLIIFFPLSLVFKISTNSIISRNGRKILSNSILFSMFLRPIFLLILRFLLAINSSANGALSYLLFMTSAAEISMMCRASSSFVNTIVSSIKFSFDEINYQYRQLVFGALTKNRTWV